MDQLTAYRILRLEPGCSPEEIRAAYAALSKEFHPEEQPEEFQKIHEAYRLLVRMNRSRRKPEPERGSRAPFEADDPAKPGESRTERKDFDEILRRTEERINAEQRVRNLEDYENLQQAREERARREFEETLQETEEELLENETRYNFDEVLQHTGRADDEIPAPKDGEDHGQCDFDRVMHREAEERETDRGQYDFDRVMHQEAEKEADRVHQLCQKALLEMELLMSPQYRNNVKIYREFFKKAPYQEILRNREFLSGFCRMLEASNLKKEIYAYIVDVYRLRGADPDSLRPEIAGLYRVLAGKGGMKKKKNGWACAIPVAFLAAIRSGVKSGARVARHADQSGVFIVGCILVAVLCFFVWIYRKLTQKHSSVFAQFIIALCLTLSQFIMLGTEAYAPFIGVVGSDTLGFLLFALGFIWLVVLLIVSVAQKIKKK